jgi:hypothetical protein
MVSLTERAILVQLSVQVWPNKYKSTALVGPLFNGDHCAVFHFSSLSRRREFRHIDVCIAGHVDPAHYSNCRRVCAWPRSTPMQ